MREAKPTQEDAPPRTEHQPQGVGTASTQAVNTSATLITGGAGTRRSSVTSRARNALASAAVPCTVYERRAPGRSGSGTRISHTPGRRSR